VRVPLPDGALLWLQPLSADEARHEAAERVAQARHATEFMDRALVLAGVAVWRIDLRTRRIHFNVIGFKVIGIHQDPAGIDLDQLRSTIHPDDLPAVLRGAEEAMASDRVVEVTARYKTVGGGWLTLLTRRVAERDPSGQVTGFAGISLDITSQLAERERAEALAERTLLVAEVLGLGFWSRDDEPGAAYWDDQMYRIYGLDPTRGPPRLAEWLAQCVHAQDRDRMAAQVSAANAPAAARPMMTEATFRICAEPGQERWVQSWTRRIVRGGRRLSYGMHLEVTERQRAQQQTRREHLRAQMVIDAVGVGIWERDPQGAVTYWNAAMYAMRGLQADDPRAPEQIMRETAHPEDRALLQQMFLRHLQSGEPYRHELRVQMADGQWRWLVTQGHAVSDEDGRLLGMVGVNLDVTERKTAELLRQEKLRVEQASRDKSAFMARMSHELRTPMNAVLGFTRLLADDAADPPSARQRERLVHIDTAGQRLMTLIDDLLDIAQREAPPAPARPASSLHVLCVEDNPVNLLLVRELLALRPAVRLRTAENGASGIAAALAEKPDLLLLDLQLPDFSGHEVMRRLRAEPALAGCRIVALSADAMPSHIEAALEAGFDEYWTKPIQFDHFLAGIDRLAAEFVKAPDAP
jgi:PAS domain S-box-containing protein